nr:hypothetical protein Iba_contig3154CG0010 [Ipomoea batatas]
MRLKCAIKLWCVRTYLIPDRVVTNSIKSRECLFHDKEYYIILLAAFELSKITQVLRKKLGQRVCSQTVK